MRGEDEVRAQLEFVRRVAATSPDVDEGYAALLWVLELTEESPADRWRDYLAGAESATDHHRSGDGRR